MRRSLVASAVLMVGVLSLTACVSPQHDTTVSPQTTQSADHSAGIGQTVDDFNLTKGLPSAVYKLDAKTGDISTDGTPLFVTAINVVLVPGTGVTDADAMLDWIMRAGWSISDNKPAHVIAQVTYVGYDNVDWDYATAISDQGLSPSSVIKVSGGSVTFSFTAAELQAALGDWPGAAPTFPSAALGARDGKDTVAQAFDVKKPLGVKSIDVDTQQQALEFRFTYATSVTVILEDGYRPADDKNALFWLLATAWSINDHKPESVILKLTYSDGSPVLWNPGVVLEGWGFGRPTSDTELNFYGPDLEALMGPWPGKVPTAHLDGIFELSK